MSKSEFRETKDYSHRELTYYFCGECNIRYSKEYIKDIHSFNKIGGIICPKCRKALRYKKKNSLVKKIS